LEEARLIAHFIELIDVARDQRKSGGAFAGEPLRYFAPESLRCAGDENVFARELTHACKCSVRKLLAQRNTADTTQHKPKISLCP
jgi:hypothetical protein